MNFINKNSQENKNLKALFERRSVSTFFTEKMTEFVNQSIADIGLWSCARNKKAMHFNEGFLKIYDADPGSKARFFNDSRFYTAGGLEKITESIENALRDAQTINLTLPITTGKGKLKMVRIIGVPILKEGQVSRIDGTIQDVTEVHYSMEEAILKEEILDSYLNGISDMIFLIDSDSVIRDYHARKESYLFAPPEDFLNKKIADILPPGVAALVLSKIQAQQAKQQQVIFEYDLEMQGDSHHYEYSMSWLEELDLFLAIIRDTTLRFNTLKQLQKSENRFKKLLENAPFPVIIARVRDGSMRYGNNRAKTQLGFRDNEGVGMTSSEFYVNLEDRDQFLETLQKQGFVNDFELQLLDYNKNPYWALMSGSIVEFENEPAVMVSINDITRKKEAELALKNEKRLLLERIKEQVCIQDVLKITEDSSLSVEEIMHRLLKVITSGWQFPEITSVQIVISGKKYETENFKKSPWMQVEERMTGSGERVLLSIAYSEEKPLESEGLFFKEERKLVRAIINRIVDTLNLRSKEAIIFERNELINLMFSQTTDSIGIFDPVLNKFIEFNENAYKDLGYAKEEFALLTPDQFQAEYSAELIKENIQRVSKGQKASFETQHKKKNGELQEAKVTLTPINNYGKPFICVVWHDITEQKRQLKEQQEANAKLIQHAQIIRKISSMKSGIDGDIYSFTRDITVLIADDMKIDRVSFWELNEERTVFECIDLYLQDQKVHSKGTLITEKEFPGFFDMISSNLILSISNISTDPRAREFFEGYMKPKGIMSLMAYPVFFSGNIIGFIGISQKKRARFMEK